MANPSLLEARCPGEAKCQKAECRAAGCVVERTKYPLGDTRNGPLRFDLWPETGHFETEPKR